MDLNAKPDLELNPKLNLKSNVKLGDYQKLQVFISTMTKEQAGAELGQAQLTLELDFY